MKRNAIVRIVIFSITIVMLLGILVFGIAYGRYSANLYSGHGELEVGPVAYGENTTMGAVNAGKISKLGIEWAAGSITIMPGEDTDSIRFWDDYSGDEKYLLYYTISEDTLKIQFCENDWENLGFGIHLGSTFSKNLVVEVPENWLCEKLEIDAASAKLEVHDLTIREVEIDTASGACGFENCNVDTLDIDTASGDVIYSGMLNAVDCDGASASIVVNVTNIPSRIDMDTASGNLDITLPENAGFTASVDGLSTKFKSDFDFELINGCYVCGDGRCRIDVSAMSGNVYIRQNSNLTYADVTLPDETQP